MPVALDACALIAFLVGEDGSDRIAEVLSEEECYAHSLNVYEVYYDMLSRDGEETAGAVAASLREVGIKRVDRLDDRLIGAAARIRFALSSMRHRMALADYFCVALANEIGARVVTSDHLEFQPILDNGICPVEFFRPARGHLKV